ncbi:hypothetical protein HQ520_15620 [bacterium]|nr:hypothetical protein [bacterium]
MGDRDHSTYEPNPREEKASRLSSLHRIRARRTDSPPQPFDKRLRAVRRTLAVTLFIAIAVVTALCLAPIEDSYVAQGVVLPSDYGDIFAPIDGLLQERYVSEDDTVTSGQILLRLEIPGLHEEVLLVQENLENLEAELQVKQAEREIKARLPLPAELWEISQQVAKSQNDLEFFKAQLDRAQKLAESGVASEQEVDRARLQYDQSKIEVDRLQERFNLIKEGYGDILLKKMQAEEHLIDTRIRGVKRRLAFLQDKYNRLSIVSAPGDGCILRIPKKHEGQMIRQGDLLVYMSLGDDQIVRISGTERNLHKVRRGQPVRYKPEMYDAMRYASPLGKVFRISEARRPTGFGDNPAAESAEGVYFIYASLSPPQPSANAPRPELKIDSQVTAQIILEKRRLFWLLLGID